jgi:uncharacterized glyoxalase superfamily protein PhnB
VTPYLQVQNTGDAIAWYERVFLAKEMRARLVAPDGTCMNAEIEIEGARLMLADEIIATRLREVPEGEMVAAFKAMVEK